MVSKDLIDEILTSIGLEKLNEKLECEEINELNQETKFVKPEVRVKKFFSLA